MVVLDPTDGVGKHTQRYFSGHRDAVTAQSVCLSKSGTWSVVASAELGPMPRICVWDPLSCTTVCEGRCPHGRSVSHMCWSPDGSVLMSVGTDGRKTLCFWTADSRRGRLRLLQSHCLLPAIAAPVSNADFDASLGFELPYPPDCVVGLEPSEAAEETLWKREQRRRQNRSGAAEDDEEHSRPLHARTVASRVHPGKILGAAFVAD